MSLLGPVAAEGLCHGLHRGGGGGEEGGLGQVPEPGGGNLPYAQGHSPFRQGVEGAEIRGRELGGRRGEQERGTKGGRQGRKFGNGELRRCGISPARPANRYMTGIKKTSAKEVF